MVSPSGVTVRCSSQTTSITGITDIADSLIFSNKINASPGKGTDKILSCYDETT